MRARKKRLSGDEAQSRAASVRWLLGEGPLPDHLTINMPQDREPLEHVRWDDLKVKNASRRTDFDVLAFETDILKLRKRNLLTPANRALSAKTTAWQDLARTKATVALKHHGAHRDSALQLTMKLCGLDVWNPRAKYEFDFTKGGIAKITSITAETLYLFLLIEFSFPYSP